MNHTEENLKLILSEKDRDIYYHYRILDKTGHGLAKELGLTYAKVLSAVRRAEQDIQGIQRVSYSERYLYEGTRYPSAKGKRMSMSYAARLCGRSADFIRSRMAKGHRFSDVLDQQEKIEIEQAHWMDEEISELKIGMMVKLNKYPFSKWGEAA